MPAGLRYIKDLNEDLAGIKTPAIYDENLDEWIILNGSHVKSAGGLWLPLQLDENGKLKSSIKDAESLETGLTLINGNIESVKSVLGEVDADPAANTLLERLKKIGTILMSKNTELKAKTPIVWDGSKTTDSIEIPLGQGGLVHVYVENGADQDVTVSLEHEVESSVWIPYAGADGALAWKVIKNTGKGVYGPIQGWPRYIKGRVVLTAVMPPTNALITYIQVQEV